MSENEYEKKAILTKINIIAQRNTHNKWWAYGSLVTILPVKYFSIFLFGACLHVYMRSKVAQIQYIIFRSSLHSFPAKHSNLLLSLSLFVKRNLATYSNDMKFACICVCMRTAIFFLCIACLFNILILFEWNGHRSYTKK